MTDLLKTCPVCKHELSAGHQPWHLLCKNCAYEKSNLQPTINSYEAHQLIKEADRAAGLQDLRLRNFKTILQSIKKFKSNGASLLDVGCAHGRFLETSRNDFDVLGLEPDKNVFDETSSRGLPIRMGYFPDALDASEKFDVIIFNDVIEHIPDIKQVISSCYQHLNKDGLLVLNLPSTDGVFYKLSKLLLKIGRPSSFERLWQNGLPSPHLHYFNSRNLIDLLNSNGFEVKKKENLATIGLAGLYTRISYTGDLNFLTRIGLYTVIALSLPILKILPSDIFFVVSMRKRSLS